VYTSDVGYRNVSVVGDESGSVASSYRTTNPLNARTLQARHRVKETKNSEKDQQRGENNAYYHQKSHLAEFGRAGWSAGVGSYTNYILPVHYFSAR
jgi:hypothetical protein